MRTIFSKICLTMFLDKCWCWWNFGICPRMSVFTFDSVQASNKRTKFNLNPTEKANVLVHIFYNCLAHILLSSEYTLERILIAQESFKIILCTCSRNSPGFVSQKSLEVAHQWASWLLVFLWLLVFNIQYIGQAVQEHIRCKNKWVPSDSKHNTIVIYNPSPRTAGVNLEIIATLSWKLLKSKTLASSNLDNVAHYVRIQQSDWWLLFYFTT